VSGWVWVWVWDKVHEVLGKGGLKWFMVGW